MRRGRGGGRGRLRFGRIRAYASNSQRVGGLQPATDTMASRTSVKLWGDCYGHRIERHDQRLYPHEGRLRQ